VAVPGGPGADLVVVEPCLVFAGSEAFFDRPSGAGHVDEFTEARPLWVVAAVEREFTIGDRPPNQVVEIGLGGPGERPVVDPVSLCSDTAGAALPGISRQLLCEDLDLLLDADAVAERGVLRYR
jgi:hypothetical protein